MYPAPRSVWAMLIPLALLAGGCEKTEKSEDDTAKAGDAVAKTTPAGDDANIDSKDILARTDVADEVHVKHVLLAWKSLAGAYRGRMDDRAKKRTEADAVKLATELADKLRADPKQIDALVKEHSEDPGSLAGTPYEVTPRSQFVPPFRNLALRLKLNEVGIVRTTFGFHVMVRVPPPPPDPLASADVLARPAKADSVRVQHVLIGWKDLPGRRGKADPRAQARTKADADKLAQTVLAKIRAGGDMAALMKEYSEDPSSKDNARIYDITANTPMGGPFAKLSLRLDIGEAGMVVSPFGWHVVKRVPPPPPDPLESADILARKPATDKAKVKHILLSWKDGGARDPRGKKRTRAQLDKLVKKTVTSLRKGDAIEPLMAKLSEDPGSAKTGKSYDVDPNAALVPPFKALSLRLNKDEVGVVKTNFGFHIIKRVE